MANAARRVLLSWSSGKDSAWSLFLLRQNPEVELEALVTTFNGETNRVAMHSVRRVLVEAQAREIGLPLWSVDLPWPCSNEIYEDRMQDIYRRAEAQAIEAVAFGDLFLQDIRGYRERQLAATRLSLLFPVWQIPTRELAQTLIRSGVKAKVTCIDPAKLDVSCAGREYDQEFLNNLPQGVDPCGENGEFHTLVYEAPVFRSPIRVEVGDRVERDGFVFADVLPV
jgi:uncharacterized protein (TIGR00290 family)